jgi:hypothetical protein
MTRLTCSDLTTAVELDSKAMKAVTGGKRAGPSFDFSSSISYSFFEAFSAQSATTAQTNGLAQSADVYSAIDSKGSFATIGGGYNGAHQGNTSYNSNGY